VDRGKDPLELMLLELLPFRGFFANFDLACLNLRPGAGIPRRKIDFDLPSSVLCLN
jgi:hypothetical protein